MHCLAGCDYLDNICPCKLCTKPCIVRLSSLQNSTKPMQTANICVPAMPLCHLKLLTDKNKLRGGSGTRSSAMPDAP